MPHFLTIPQFLSKTYKSFLPKGSQNLPQKNKTALNFSRKRNDSPIQQKAQIREINPVLPLIPKKKVDFPSKLIKTKLFNHQREAYEFLVEKMGPEMEDSGCILAHSPGTGKTLTAISFLVNCFIPLHNQEDFDSELTKFSKSTLPRALILAPLSCLHQWESEFQIWVEKRTLSILNFRVLGGINPKEENFEIVENWIKRGGILLTNYDQISRTKRYTKQLKRVDFLICDEAHEMRNEDTNKFKVGYFGAGKGVKGVSNFNFPRICATEYVKKGPNSFSLQNIFQKKKLVRKFVLFSEFQWVQRVLGILEFK